MDSGDKLEYGEKEILDSLDNGYLEIIVMTSKMEELLNKKQINMIQKCQDMSCQLQIINEDTVVQMGGIIGKKWW